jgi:hypothetical protein
MPPLLLYLIAIVAGLVLALWLVVLLQALDVLGPLPFDLPGT